jgi:hypothetical protein
VLVPEVVEYILEFTPKTVLARRVSRPTVDINPDAPRPIIELVNSTGSIMEDTYVFTPATVEFRMAVRPIADTKPTVPRPTIDEVSSTGSIMLEILLLIPIIEERNWPVEMYPAVPRPITVLWRFVE